MSLIHKALINKKLKTAFVYCILCWISVSTLFSQVSSIKGVPPITNFEPALYQFQGKVWDIDSAPSGIIYMSSDKSLIEYDGLNWKYYEGSKSVIRSILVKGDSLIYTGSDLDFGFWHRTKLQQFEYTSLYPFKEELKEINEEFWGTYSIDGKIYFVSSSNIYVYDQENLTKIPVENKILKSFHFQNQLFFYCEDQSLYFLDNLSPKKYISFQQKNEIELVGLFVNSNNEYIAVSKSNGLFSIGQDVIVPINNDMSRYLKEEVVFDVQKLSNGRIAFGTIKKGLLISTIDGEILYKINRNNGLLNNTILNIHQSNNGMLWLSMDYGLAKIYLNSPLNIVVDQSGKLGNAQSALLSNNDLFLGTNQGLFHVPWNQLNGVSSNIASNFIPNSEGQVWTIKAINNQLLVGHDKGLFLLRNKKLESIDRLNKGFWSLITYQEDYLLGGTYNGIAIFQKVNGTWKYLKQMEFIVGSCNQLLIDSQNTLWVNIPNYGIIQSKLDANLTPINREIYLQDEFNSQELSLKQNEGSVVVSTPKLDYNFSYDKATFSPIKQSSETTISNEVYWNQENIIPLNDQFDFIPTYNGFALRAKALPESDTKKELKLVLRSLSVFDNQLTYQIANFEEVTSSLRNIDIQFIVPNEQNVLYQYKLDNYGNGNWSEWTKESKLALVNLDFGEHRFQIRARKDGEFSNIQEVVFFINRPWYLSNTALAMYILSALILVYVVRLRQKKRLKNYKKQIERENEQHVRKEEQARLLHFQRTEFSKLKNEYNELTRKFNSKSIELASKTKEMDEQRLMIHTLKEKINDLKSHPESMNSRVGEIENLLKQTESTDSSTFELQMEELNKDFYKKLKRNHPDLTSNDLKLCVFIKAGFNSKEIAQLLKIKPSSVYISRSRLRKKLEMDSNEDLQSYFNNI